MKMCAVALSLSLLAAAVWLGLTMTTPESSGGGGNPGGGEGRKGCVPTLLSKAPVNRAGRVVKGGLMECASGTQWHGCLSQLLQEQA